MAVDEPTAPTKAEAPVPAEEEVTLAEFFEKVPPSQSLKVSDVCEAYFVPRTSGLSATRFRLHHPEIQLHCGHEKCGGQRTFRWEDGAEDDPPKPQEPIFYRYLCSNCRRTTKTYSFWVGTMGPDHKSARCYKFGEYPSFGSPTPTRLLKLLGDDRAIYIKGRQCENQGLGVGAFAYYRRVVENQRNAIIDEIVRVSMKLKASDELVQALLAAKNENQFTQSIEAIKDGIPQVLFIDGHNPLTLLHKALSKGLHAETDRACLEAAHVIRIVLADLVERVGQALKSEAELTTALGRLMGNPASGATR
jgi:hypothetical protein